MSRQDRRPRLEDVLEESSSDDGQDEVARTDSDLDSMHTTDDRCEDDQPESSTVSRGPQLVPASMFIF